MLKKKTIEKQILEAMKILIEKNSDLVSIAARQRASFEGWLKFELARYLEKKLHVTDLTVEYKTIDIAFKLEEVQYWLELKTPSFGEEVEGVRKPSDGKRNSATNMQVVTIDGEELRIFFKEREKENLDEVALIAFAAFPIA